MEPTRKLSFEIVDRGPPASSIPHALRPSLSPRLRQNLSRLSLSLSLRPPQPSHSPPRGPRSSLAPPPLPPHGRLAVGCRATANAPPLLPPRARPDVACRAACAFQKLDAVAVREEEEAFREAAAAGHTLLPLRRCIFSDHLTPVLAYRCLVREDDREAPSFLFESVEQGAEGTYVGRYSVVGAQPAMEVVAKANHVTVMDHEMRSKKEQYASDPMTVPRDIVEQWNPQITDDGLPDVFCGGWAGFFSYDTMRYIETKKLPFSKAPQDDRNLPDIHLGLYNDVVVFDHVEKKTHVIHWVRLDCYHSIDEAYEDGKNRLEAVLSRLHSSNVPTLSAGSIKPNVGHFSSALQKSSMSNEYYKKSVVQAKEHILAGDIFQVVLSQRFERRTFADPFEVYRALRIVNPSPYMAYLRARGCILVASSHEILTRVAKGTIVNRPLAGTIRRGKTKAEDKVLERLLLSDEKQRAEHIMLVDLGRNDLEKVSKPGTVKVEKLMNIERYSHVMHISSTVTGELRDDLTCWDALRAALPVGTVSGAPKVRAMELIDEMEVNMRGPFSGGFGWISFGGDMEIALVLRTIVFPTASRFDTMYSYAADSSSARQEWVAHLQTGAGIVADSNPDVKLQECQNKAAGLARAIDLAESAFLDFSDVQDRFAFISPLL